MPFTIGETVVYPHHGTCVIEEITERTVKGEQRQYLTLRPTDGDLTIKVPADKIEAVGVRDVTDEKGLEEVFDVLRAQEVEEPTNWSRRYKANVEKIKSNDIMKVAEVVRDLSRRDGDRGLSAGEKHMLSKARQVLSSEVASSRNISEDAANELIDEVLGVESTPEAD